MKDHYRVFVSSTCLDNGARRRTVVEAIQRAGQMVAIRMERFSADDRPTVDVCRARAAGCELFVGIVAHRYGWEPEGQPPGEEKSITWLEYEAARAAGKPCLMFEIDPAAAPPDSGEGADQRAKLERFKAAYARDQLKAVFTDDNLGMMVQQALVEWRERQEQDGGLGPELRRYGDEALKAHGTLVLSGFTTRLRVPIDLEELYVPLRATSDLRGHGEAGFADSRHAREALEREGLGLETALMDAFRLAARVKRKGMVILGEPGSGKTTHLKRLLICCLKEGAERLGLPAGMAPVLLPLRGLEDPERETVEHFIERHLNQQLSLPSDFGKRLLSRGRLLLLFDGLDEVSDPDRREQVAHWVERVLRAHPTCWPVVTCRFAGYGEQGAGRSAVRLGAEFLELHVQPLRDGQPEDFVRKWYRLVEGGLNPDAEAAAQLAEERAGDLIRALRTGDRRTARVAEMVGNPLLLANLCLVHRDHGRLPADRRRLYEECVDVLLERWRERQGPWAGVKVDQAKRALQPVAEWLHRQAGRTRARAEELAPVLAPALKAARWEAGGAESFLAAVRDESGLLTGWGPRELGFMHLGFQEYLAAAELRRMAAEAGEERRVILEELARHYGESWWQEVLLLFVAMGNPSLFGPLMEEVVKQPAFAEHRELLALMLEEAAERDPRPFLDLARLEPGQDLGLWRRQRVALETLRQLGENEALAKLEGALRYHPSPEIRAWMGVEPPPAPSAAPPVLVKRTERGGVELVSIPGGTFLMGSPPDESGRTEDEAQRPASVGPFALGRHPVTNAQYGAFLEENPGVRTPLMWGDRRFNQAEQPVVGVTWDEARLFARWAGARLPTEAEWEYACRAGTTAARYAPELDAIAWHAKNSGAAPHPVGQKQPNAWGLHDMLGNVWEWCGDPKRRASGEKTSITGPIEEYQATGRVVRGGSWDSDALRVRAASRSVSDPTVASNVVVGFRLARDEGGPPVAAERSARESRVEVKRPPLRLVAPPPAPAPRPRPLPRDPPPPPPALVETMVTEQGGVRLVRIPRGVFLMGSPPGEPGRHQNEGPEHPVLMSPFWLGREPVTNEQYERFLKANPRVRPPDHWGNRRFNQPAQPVVGVTWGEAKAFAEWAGGRLPTEAEWEYACRAGTSEARYARDLDAIAWYRENSGGASHPVGLKRPNDFGLYDMLGNVWEWCGDGWRRYPERDAVEIDPVGPDSGSYRVVRGGSWDSPAENVRAADRSAGLPVGIIGHVGFRMARSAS